MQIFLEILKDTLGATVGVLSLAFIGVYLTKLGYLDKNVNKIFSKLIEQLFTPCLILSSFVQSLDLTDQDSWLPAVTICIIQIATGLLLGKLLNQYILKDEYFNSIILLTVSLSMTTNVQLNVSHNLRDYLEEISVQYVLSKGNDISVGETRAITYIMINTFISTIARWTVGKQIIQQLHHQQQLEEQQNMQNQRKSFVVESIQEVKKWYDAILKYMNPPIVASLSSLIFLLCFPSSFREKLLETGSIYNRAIFNTIYIMGQAQPPLVLLTLGSNLYTIFINRNNGETKMENKTLVGISITKLIIVPLAGSVILCFLRYLQFIQDPVLLFVSIISFSTPSAVNLLVIGQLYAPQISSEISKILLVGYLCYIVTLPIIMILFFNFLM